MLNQQIKVSSARCIAAWLHTGPAHQQVKSHPGCMKSQALEPVSAMKANTEPNLWPAHLKRDHNHYGSLSDERNGKAACCSSERSGGVNRVLQTWQDSPDLLRICLAISGLSYVYPSEPRVWNSETTYYYLNPAIIVRDAAGLLPSQIRYCTCESEEPNQLCGDGQNTSAESLTTTDQDAPGRLEFRSPCPASGIHEAQSR